MSKKKGEEIPRREFLSKSAKVVAAVSATAALAKGSAAGREGGPGADAPAPAIAADSKSAPPPACSSERYDVVIIGTGFGAAVAADTLLRKNKDLKVLLLERGVWWFTTERPLPHDKTFGTDVEVIKGRPVQYWVKPDHHRGVKDMLSVVQPNRFKSPLQHPAASPLYRYNTFPNIDILTASAVGGGSTIYSNVTIEPHREGDSYPVMKDWPENTRLTADDYHRVDTSPQKNNPGAIQWMEDRRGPLNSVVTKAPLSKKWLESEGLDLADLDKNDDKRAFLYLGKSRALKDAAKKGVSGWKNEPWAPLPLALFEQTDTLTKTATNALPAFCERQGRCFLGCMPGARHTLNKMMIAKILSKFPNVTLENYADVSHIEFIDQGTYKVWLKDAKDSQKAAGCRVASKVIVSAGTLGSTEILLRSRAGYQGKNFTGNLRLSNKLGHQFSSNGDFGGFTVPKNGGDPSVAQSLLPYPVFPTKGPINTSHVMFTKGDIQINIEDAAIPSMFAPLVRTALNVLGSTPSSGSGKKQVFEFFGIMHKLWRSGKFSNTDKKPWDDPFAPLFPGIPDPRMPRSFATEHEMLQEVFFYNCMGKDNANGTFSLSKKGLLELDYPIDDINQPIFKEITAILTALSENMGGTYRPFPLWEGFPEMSLGFLKRKAITVHPLGGCPMGNDSSQGAVDPRGRVFNTTSGSQSVYENLYVMDASIIPGPVAVNPTLTIVAMSLKIAQGIQV